LPLMVLSATVMAEVLLAITLALPHLFMSKTSVLMSISGLAVLVVTGIVTYFVTCHLNGALRFSELKAAMRR
jgi:hypothetical protein